MVELERGDPNHLRSTVLIYSDFNNFGNLPDGMKENFGNRKLGLFASLDSNSFASNAEILTRDPYVAEMAKQLYNNSRQPEVPQFANKVLGLIIPFKSMYRSTIEGDLIYAGKTSNFMESIKQVNQYMTKFVLAYLTQNDGVVILENTNSLNLTFMKCFKDLPEENRSRHIFQTYVQPMMHYFDNEDMLGVQSLARELEHFCYDSFLSPEAKKIVSLVSEGRISEIQSHLELILAVADQRFLDAARIRDSISN